MASMDALTLQTTLRALLAYDIPLEVCMTQRWSGCTWEDDSALDRARDRRYASVSVGGANKTEQQTLMSGLHEVGHTHFSCGDLIADRRALNRGGNSTVGLLENEAQAWLWALDYCEREGIALERATVDRIDYCFNSYRREPGDAKTSPSTPLLIQRIEALR